MTNIACFVEQAALKRPDKPAIVFEGATLSYAELNTLANRTANVLVQMGVHSRDRVAIFLPNIPQFASVYLGVLKLGAIAVSIISRLKVNEVGFILENCSASALVTTSELLDNVPKSLDIPIFVFDAASSGNVYDFNKLLSLVSSQREALHLDPNTPASILYTSGTTGKSKGAILSHQNVIANIEALAYHHTIEPDDRILVPVPLYHAFGQNAIMNCAFAVGATLILHRQFNPKEVLHSIASDRANKLYGVPTIFIWLLNTPLTAHNLSSLRACYSAAAKLPEAIVHRWQQQFKVPIFDIYGLSETTVATFNHDYSFRLGSIGTPLMNTQMAIVDESDNPVPPRTQGEIVIRGPNVMLGYWNLAEETTDAMRGGWYHTGDIGFVDEDGYFYITDRLKDMINVSGLKVYPAEVEDVLYQHPAISEVAVFGVPDDLTGEKVWASVVLRPTTLANESELIAFCLERIAAFKVPRHIQFAESIPKSPVGKVLKRVLKQEASR